MIRPLVVRRMVGDGLSAPRSLSRLHGGRAHGGRLDDARLHDAWPHDARLDDTRRVALAHYRWRFRRRRIRLRRDDARTFAVPTTAGA